MTNIHFIYSVPSGNSRIAKLQNRLIQMIQSLGIPLNYLRNRDAVQTNLWPFNAPYSITRCMYQALKQKGRVLLYDWKEQISIKGNNQDILIGHPYPNKSENDKRIWNSSCLTGDFLLRIALVPIHHRMAEYCANLEPYISSIDAIFGITGPYWYDTWKESVFSHWYDKIIPLDMAIDINFYPRVKRRFNPKGKRKFLFIGNGEPYKGAHLLSILFGLEPKQKCIWLGSDRHLPNLDSQPARALNPEFMKKIAEECDFLITMGVSDANPTTILEAMAWGFPVCCTPQSGYYDMPEIFQLSITDMKHNQKIINELQNASEETLIVHANSARELVKKKYTWKRFTETAINGIEKLVKDKR